MPRHKEHLKNDNGEPKVVVVWDADNSLVRPNILKLGGLMRWRTNRAEPPRAIHRYLIRITVNQPDGGIAADQQVIVLHVADDVPTFVNDGKCSGRVGGTPD
jgi:hypothetical protein